MLLRGAREAIDTERRKLRVERDAFREFERRLAALSGSVATPEEVLDRRW